MIFIESCITVGFNRIGIIFTNNKTLFPICIEVDAVDCNSEPKTNEGRLRKKLFCGYDKSSRPTLNDGTIMIKVKMIIKGFDFDDFGGKLTVSTWLAMVNKVQALSDNSFLVEMEVYSILIRFAELDGRPFEMGSA